MELLSLKERLAEAQALAASRTIKTEEGRLMIVHHIRLIETLIDQKATTPLPSSHHK